jgi:hypothetical protein
MTIETITVKTKELTPDPHNARLHTPTNLEAIRSSLERFGQRKPIVITEDRTVIAGNGTLHAALALGLPTLTAVVFTGTPDEARAYAIADNRTAELARWEENALAELLSSLPDPLLAAAGYTTMAVDDLLASIQESQDPELTLTGDYDARFSAVASRSLIATYLRNDFDTAVTMFSRIRGEYGMDSNSEALSYLLDLAFGEPA